jgi:hypothetical protein
VHSVCGARCPPFVLGHALAVGAVLLAAGLAEMVAPLGVLRVAVAWVLVAFAVYRLCRHRHPRFGGMQVGFRDLTAWSFLMASAHGAGFMVLPFVMAMPEDVLAANGEHACHMIASGTAVPWTAAMALSLHTLAYFVVMALAAWIVYRKLGLALLRTAWFNLDWLWAGALVVSGTVVLFT